MNPVSLCKVACDVFWRPLVVFTPFDWLFSSSVLACDVRSSWWDSSCIRVVWFKDKWVWAGRCECSKRIVLTTVEVPYLSTSYRRRKNKRAERRRVNDSGIRAVVNYGALRLLSVFAMTQSWRDIRSAERNRLARRRGTTALKGVGSQSPED